MQCTFSVSSVNYSLRDNIWRESFSTINRSTSFSGRLLKRTYILVCAFPFSHRNSSHLLKCQRLVFRSYFVWNESNFGKKREHFIVLIQLWKLWWHCAKMLENAFKSIEINFNDYFELYRNNNISAGETPFGVYSHVRSVLSLSFLSHFRFLALTDNNFSINLSMVIVQHIWQGGQNARVRAKGKSVAAKVIDLINCLPFTF